MNKTERNKRTEDVLAAWATARNNGISQADFARAAGISDRTLRQWVADHDASPDRLTRLIADAQAVAGRLQRALDAAAQAQTGGPAKSASFAWE